MRVLSTAGIEFAFAFRADRIAVKILPYRKLMPARSAQDRFCFSLVFRPKRCFVISLRRMTLEARKPLAAALEFYRNDVKIGLPMNTSGLSIDIDTSYFLPVNHPFH